MSPRKDDNLGNNKQEKAGTKTTSLSSSQHMQWNDSEPGSTSTSCIHSCMTVMGIYKKGKAPRAHKDLPPEQIMVRQRLHTRQLYPMDNNNNLVGDVEASKQQKIKKNNYDVAMFHPIQGLVVVMDDNKDDDDVAPLYHTDIDRHSDSNDDEKRVYEERAILWQSVETYQSLLRDPSYNEYVCPTSSETAATTISEGSDAAIDDDVVEKAIEKIIFDSPRFGEQIIVQGMDASNISIGDIFEVENGHSTLKVEVTSPRLPCWEVDRCNNSAPYGMKGLKRYTMTNGLAGWFTRVVVGGELRDGMKFIRTFHPHPKWTITEVAKALYGEGPKRRQLMGSPFWNRSQEELQELCNIQAFGRNEWKNEATWILNGNDKDYEQDKKKKRQEEKEEETKGRVM